MGKRYYCDYCDKTMSSAPSIIRTHNQGITHQRIVQDHYQLFKDPETILAEESGKKPCNKFFKGECKFGSICRFSHYTYEQLEYMRNLVASKISITNALDQPSFTDLYTKLQNRKQLPDKKINEMNILYDSNGNTHVLPWKYNHYIDEDLPPSLKRYRIEDFIDSQITEWG